MNAPAHGPLRRARWPWLLAIGVVVVAIAATGGIYAVTTHGSVARTATGGRTGAGGAGGGGSVSPSGPTTTTTPVAPLEVSSTTPSSGARHVASNATVTVRFSAPVTLSRTTPTLRPAVSGTWSQAGPTSLEFTPTEAMIPYTAETVTVPGGRAGLRDDAGGVLAEDAKVRFTIADGSTRRVQELLAGLDYLPLRFTPSGGSRPTGDDALARSGSFAWRWADLPTPLRSLWRAGTPNVITRGAIMSFEERNGLSVDGVAGPEVWKTLLRNAAGHDEDGARYAYVLVSKTLPEHLQLWADGHLEFADIPVNTGAPGADTTDGTYPVFEHVTASDMSGTNPDGSTYDDKAVPWASFFNHGDALHGFVRATYGSPQSNGCVEMPIATAARVWPYTPIGTLVTVVGAKVT